MDDQKINKVLGMSICPHQPPRQGYMQDRKTGVLKLDASGQPVIVEEPVLAIYCPRCRSDVAGGIAMEKRLAALEERIDRLFREGGPGRGNTGEQE